MQTSESSSAICTENTLSQNMFVLVATGDKGCVQLSQRTGNLHTVVN